MSKYFSRVTSSARGEIFNPLTWPFLFATLVYGMGFILHTFFSIAGESVLFNYMAEFGLYIPVLWGVIAILNIIGGLTFLMFNIPPFGKASGIVGFMLWVFAGFSYGVNGAVIPLLAVAVPNMFFWIWQYISLTKFRRQDARDERTMERYNSGGYDNVDPKVDGEQERLDNRGVDEQ